VDRLIEANPRNVSWLNRLKQTVEKKPIVVLRFAEALSLARSLARSRWRYRHRARSTASGSTLFFLEHMADAARALRDMDLLRIQDNVTCQAVVQVRERSTRAYVVKRQILEWKSGESYKSYNPATNKLANGLDNVPGGRR
jgi:hypothetical protein